MQDFRFISLNQTNRSKNVFSAYCIKSLIYFLIDLFLFKHIFVHINPKSKAYLWGPYIYLQRKTI